MLGAMSALRETAGVVVVRCLHCGHEGTLSQNALTRFGLNPDAPIAAYVKRLRCSKCGSRSVMAKRATRRITDQDSRKRHA
jgi:DNA-directed RNA polymerase subunit RPC12/RpoP